MAATKLARGCLSRGNPGSAWDAMTIQTVRKPSQWLRLGQPRAVFAYRRLVISHRMAPASAIIATTVATNLHDDITGVQSAA
jgi:hypothetical protein